MIFQSLNLKHWTKQRQHFKGINIGLISSQLTHSLTERRGSWASSLAPMMNSFSGGPFHIILPRERRFSVWAGWSGDNGALFLDVLSLSPDMEASYDWTLYSSLLILSLKLLLVVSTPLLLLIFSLNMVAFSFRIICGRGAWLKVWCRLYLEVKLAVSWVRLLIFCTQCATFIWNNWNFI